MVQKIAFLGGGVMARAIIQALLHAGEAEPGDVVVSDPSPVSREAFQAVGVRATSDNREATEGAEVVLLAVKPWLALPVLREVAPVLRQGSLVISIAAGITLEALASVLPEGTPVVRVMPNTPIQVGAGASAYCCGGAAAEAHAALVHRIFAAGGLAVKVQESQMDAVTGLSGSGPAYVCLMLEALADGGVKMGLPRAAAQQLAAQTLLGAARLVLESGEHPAVLKDRVATPGGTTIAGLAAMEAAGVRDGLIRAVEAATLRARELGS